jgi:hypothetical protein
MDGARRKIWVLIELQILGKGYEEGRDGLEKLTG